MRIFEILKFVNALNESLISESFNNLCEKYKDARQDQIATAKATYSELRDNPNLMTSFKQTLKPHGNFDQQIKLTYPTIQEFIDAVAAIKTEAKSNADELAAYQAAGHGKSQSKDMVKYSKYLHGNFYVIPCRTHKELKTIASALTGNLIKGLSDKEIQDRWIIEDDHVVEKEGLVRKPGSYYEELQKPDDAEFTESQISPAAYTNVYKTAPFFMQPAWCIAGSEEGPTYFNDYYNLETKEGEEPKCWVIISAEYPNIRICIAKGDSFKPNIQPGLSTLNANTGLKLAHILKVTEVRDSWQISGVDDTKSGGLTIMGEIDGMRSVADKLLEDIKYNEIDIADITSGEGMPFESKVNHDTGGFDPSPYQFKSIDMDFPKLVEGYRLFCQQENLRSFKGNLPNLCTAKYMFYASGLTSWNAPLPKLKESECMFDETSLVSWQGDLPELISADSMFARTKLTSWDTPLPKLKCGDAMFMGTPLKSWDAPLPNLETGSYMFKDAELTDWTVPLPSLKDGSKMFSDTKFDYDAVEVILKSIPTYDQSEIDEHVITIGLGFEPEQFDKEVLESEFARKGWKLDLRINV